MSIQSLIVDDEPWARQRIKRLLAAEPDIAVIAECGSGPEAIQIIHEKAPDLVFLDIQMPEMDGFEVLQRINAQKMPVIIFITAFNQHALQAFEVHALDYLLKPFKKERFKEAMNRARIQLAKNGAFEFDRGLAALIKQLGPPQNHLSRFMVKSSSRVVFVKAGDVEWIEAADNYVLLHAGGKTHIVRETMQALEIKLNPEIFQRISRSVIVNVEWIQELQPMGKGQYVIILSGGKRLTMSRGIRDLKQALEPC